MNTTTAAETTLIWAPEGLGYEAWSEDSRFSCIVRNETVYGLVFAPEGACGPESYRGKVGGGWAWEVWNEDTDRMVASGMESHAEYAKAACEGIVGVGVAAAA